MKRRSRIIIGFTAAVLTYGTLVTTIGITGSHHYRLHRCQTSCEKCGHHDHTSPLPEKIGEQETRIPATDK